MYNARYLLPDKRFYIKTGSKKISLTDLNYHAIATDVSHKDLGGTIIFS